MKVAHVLIPFILSACATAERNAPYTTEEVPTAEAGGFECNAESVQYAIGQKTGVELAAKLVRESGAQSLRWLPPRTAVTMDFLQNRLNVAYDDNMVINRISCG